MNGGSDFIRAIRGPIILITLGTLFAIDHLTPYSFWETWPVFLIVLGLLSLLQRSGRAGYYRGPGQGPQTPPPAGAAR